MKRSNRKCLKCGKQIAKAKRGEPPPSMVVCAECRTEIRAKTKE